LLFVLLMKRKPLGSFVEIVAAAFQIACQIAQMP